MTPTTAQLEATLDTLAALRRQESHYETHDFLHQEESPSSCSPTKTPLHIEIDESCRDKMVAWCFQVAKFCKFQEESVEIAMSCLDRFLLTDAGASALQDRSDYQLACMVCLYTAVKVHERTAISPAIVSALARDAYTVDQVEAMERTILMALQWRVNPPTMSSFVRNLIGVVSQRVRLSDEQQTTVDSICKFQLEIAVKDYRFITVDRSIVGYCIVMNSLDAVGVDCTASLSSYLAQALQLTDDCREIVLGVSSALYTAVVENHSITIVRSRPVTPTQPLQYSSKRVASFEESPRSVATTTRFNA